MNLPLGSQWISGFELEDSSFTPGWLEGLNRTCSNHMRIRHEASAGGGANFMTPGGFAPSRATARCDRAAP